MFICTELIEETGRPPGLIFGMWRYFWPGSDKFDCHLFECVKNHINAYISHPIRDRNVKT